MATVTIPVEDWLWKEFTALAKRRRRNPNKWAESLLVDAVQRLADDDLMARSERDARRSKLREEDVVEAIRQYRRDKARKAANGRSKKTSVGGT